MINKVYSLDILTFLFATGADCKKAEIRPSAIRGELRWWFRVLGGFADDPCSVQEQERDFFGGVHGVAAKGKLMVRVEINPQTQAQCKDADALRAGQNTPLGYVLFPLRSKRDRRDRRDPGKVIEDRSRGYFQPNDTDIAEAFTVHILWNGNDETFHKVEALISVWGQIGSLGFRSRRCMGALAFHGMPPCTLTEAFKVFKNPSSITLKKLERSCDNADDCTSVLSNWLKGWRSYGRTPNLNPGPGFKFAKVDHDAGLDRKGTGEVMRPPLGLPIIQRYSDGRTVNEWASPDCERFTSPILLRPFRKQNGSWVPLVLFIENRMWPNGRMTRITYDKKARPPLFFDRPVSNDLLDAIRNDRMLRDFSLSEA